MHHMKTTMKHISMGGYKPIFELFAGFYGIFGTVFYIGSIADVSSLEELFGYSEGSSSHLMRNTGFYLMLLAVLNLSCILVEESRKWLRVMHAVNTLVVLHYAIETFVFGALSKFVMSVLLAVLVLQLRHIYVEASLYQRAIKKSQ